MQLHTTDSDTRLEILARRRISKDTVLVRLYMTVFMIFCLPRYNKAHIRTRNTVERAFGVWKRRFPCLDMCLQHRLPQCISIITACAALHNLACAKREAQPPQHPRSVNHRANRGNVTQAEHLPPVTDGRLGAQAREMLIIRSFS